MPFAQLLCAVLESGCNRLNQLDSSGKQKLKGLAGKRFSLKLRTVGSCYFLFAEDGIDLLSRYEGSVDACLTLSLSAVGLLKDSSKLADYIRAGQMDLDGDLRLLQRISELFMDVEIDWEEQLSDVCGDALAHQFCSSVQRVQHVLKNQVVRQKLMLVDVLTEEWRVAPGSLEVACLCDDIAAFKRELEHVELRIDALSGGVVR